MMVKALPLVIIIMQRERRCCFTLAVAAVVLPTLFVTVRRGLPSEDALLGISFRTMATVLSAALESFPYNSEINNDLCQDRIFYIFQVLFVLRCLRLKDLYAIRLI